MNAKGIIFGAIVIMGILLLSGCIGDSSFDVNKVIESQKNVKQYAFESEITAGKMGLQQSISMNGKVDTENKKMYINTIVMGQNKESYIIGEYVYTKTNGQWYKMKMEKDNLWNNTKRYESTVEILKSPNTKANVIGEENVDGDICYKVDVLPDTEKLKEQFAKSIGENMAEVKYNLSVSSYILYISKTTNFIKKEYLNANMAVSVQDMNVEVGMTYVFKYKDINKQADIELPEEANNSNADAANQ